MEKIENKQGNWTVQTDGTLKGELGAFTRAYCVAGSEEDTNYDVYATLKLVTGTKASIIAFFTEGTNFEERYVECILDFENNKLLMELVNGAESVTVASRDFILTKNVEYEVRVVAKSEGTVLFYINNVAQLRIEDLSLIYTEGMHGYACEGTVSTNYTLFSKVYFQNANHYTNISTLISCIRSVAPQELVGKDGTVQDYYDYLTTLIEQASRFIDGETQRETNFFEEGGLSLIEYFSGIGSPVPTGLYEFTEQAEAWQTKAASLFLTQRPVLSITKIEENSAEIGAVDVWSEITKYRWFTHGEIVFASDSIPAKGTKNVRVTYVGGYTKTPIDIQMACTRLIVNMIHKTISDRTAAFVSFARPTAINFAMPEVLTPDIKGVLLRYRLLGYGEM